MEHRSAPATAARAEPMAKVMAMVLFTLIPMRVAAPRSSDTASIACPTLVLLINAVRPAMMTIHTTMVTTVSPETDSRPPASLRPGMVTTEVNWRALDPNMRSARFCSR